jgi:hypothetical protein
MDIQDHINKIDILLKDIKIIESGFLEYFINPNYSLPLSELTKQTEEKYDKGSSCYDIIFPPESYIKTINEFTNEIVKILLSNGFKVSVENPFSEIKINYSHPLIKLTISWGSMMLTD